MANFNILKYGAIGDGVTNDANAIQSAIDDCYKNGGGTVVLPAGKTYLSGRIEIKTNVNLFLQNGSVLKASPDPTSHLSSNFPASLIKEYNICKKGESTFPSDNDIESLKKLEELGSSGNFQWPIFVFIYAKDAKNITISGTGIIDGNHMEFVDDEDLPYHITSVAIPRPTLLFFENCNNTVMRDIKISNAPFWTVHTAGCDDVLMDGLFIKNDLRMANCDAIDIDHCKNVIINNCNIVSADDCIVIKNTSYLSKYGATENIIISNCILTSTSCSIKIGSESVDDFKNVLINNCIIKDSNRAIGIQLRDGGNVSNFKISNIFIDTRRFYERYWGKAEPLYITSLNRNSETTSGNIKNISFSNITCTGENGIFIFSDDKNKISDISFENIDVNLVKTSKWEYDICDIRPCIGRDDDGLIKGKISGFYANSAKNIYLKNVKFSKSDDVSKYILDDITTENVDNLKIN